MDAVKAKNAEQDEVIADVQASMDGKQDMLTAGSGISISGNTISASASAGSCTEFHEGCTLSDHLFNRSSFSIPSDVSFSIQNATTTLTTSRRFYRTLYSSLRYDQIGHIVYNKYTNQIGKLLVYTPQSDGNGAISSSSSYVRVYTLSDSQIQSLRSALINLKYYYTTNVPVVYNSSGGSVCKYTKLSEFGLYDSKNDTWLILKFSNSDFPSSAELYCISTSKTSFDIQNVTSIGGMSYEQICFVKSYSTALPNHKYYKIEESELY